jgi:hypothetical protein
MFALISVWFQRACGAAGGAHPGDGGGTRPVQEGDSAVTGGSGSSTGAVSRLPVRTVQPRHRTTRAGQRRGMVRVRVASLPSSRFVSFLSLVFSPPHS